MLVCSHVAAFRIKLHKTKYRLFDEVTRVPTSREMQKFLERNGVEVLKHPPYNSDLVPCNFWHFRELKKALRGKQFNTVAQVVVTVRAHFKTLTPENFSNTWTK